MVKLYGKWGYIDWYGNEVIPIVFDEVTHFQGPSRFVKKDGRIGLLDVAGNVTYDHERMKEFMFLQVSYLGRCSTEEVGTKSRSG